MEQSKTVAVMRAFRPVIRALNGNSFVRHAKNVRDEAIDRSFRASGRNERERFLRSFQRNADTVVFSIAYNTPWVVDLLTMAWQKSVQDADLVIVDNSSDRNARLEHRRICEARGFSYLSLPRNFEWSPLRSNAISMNWVYYNIILKIASPPRYFGFIDHDCFPIANVSFSELLRGKAVYGLRRVSAKPPEKWYLWAGFCFFQPDLIPTKHFDFKHSYEHRMDTGGRNWWPVYSRLQPTQCVDAGFRVDSFEIDGQSFHEQIIGDRFCHVGGASYRTDFSKEQIKLAYQTYLRKKYFD